MITAKFLRAFLQSIFLLVGAIIIIELIRNGALPFPKEQLPNLISISLLGLVSYISFSQGRTMSLISAVIAALYFIFFYEVTGRIEDNPQQSFQRLFVISLTLGLLGYSLGYVRERINSLLAREKLAREKAENIADAMKELEERKDAFVSMASHELRTPLTSTKVYTQLLNKYLRSKKDKQALSYIEKIDKQVDSLSGLVEDLLDLSKIQAGKMEFNEEPFDINMVASDVADMFRHMAKSHAITLNGKVQKKVYGDKQRITQVLTNLISNAIKYSPAGNKVIVSVVPREKHAEIKVKDFGKGIGIRNKSKIFDRFYRIKSNDRKQGLGLGLFISNEIIRKHNGKLWVESKFGKGSTFHFTIPYHKNH